MKRNPQLVEWEAQYPFEGLSMSDDNGILWEGRAQGSEAYFNEYSWDWEENQLLLTDVKGMEAKYGDFVMIAYPIIQNFVSDTYYRNPRPLIQDKRGNKDLGRMLTDVLESVHAQGDSERKMQDAFQDQAWAGFGVAMPVMRQQTGVGEDGLLVPEWQKIVFRTISPWKIRFDPRGREWDLSDHAYGSILLSPTLSQVMSWEWLSHDDRCRVIAWNRGGMVDNMAIGDGYTAQRIDWPTMADHEETDPDITQVPMWLHWDRTKHLVFFRPAGARFVLTPQPWPEEFEEADEFPWIYMAKNREPENKKGTNGFVGIPDIRFIRPHVLAIRRARNLFLAANMHVIFKYLTPKGALTEEQLAKFGSDAQRQVIEFDPTALDAFPVELRTDTKIFNSLLNLVPQPDLKETKHLAAIKLEFDMIAQILGQGAGDRGGMPQTDTATDSMIINQRLNQRLSTLRHEAGKHYRTLTRKTFLVIKKRQVLPLQYQMTTLYNEKVWMKFAADKLRDLDLHFDFDIGSGEPRTREKEFELRERMAALLLPILQAAGDTRLMMKVARDLYEMSGIRDEGREFFNDSVKDALKRLAMLLYGVQKGEVDPSDPKVIQEQMQLLGGIINEMLTPQDLAAARAESQNAAAPEPTGTGSSPKALSPGQMSAEAGARGSAMSGSTGGMA